MVIPTAVAPGAQLDPRPPSRIGAEFRRRVNAGLPLRADGQAANDPTMLLDRYAARYRVELFDTEFYLSSFRQNPDLRFCVAYIVQRGAKRKPRAVARLLYKDVSLVWRAASHVAIEHDGFWIGKGDVRVERTKGHEIEHTAEETTDLPFELQHALEQANQGQARVGSEQRAIALVLRNAPPERLMPYRDFYGPRRAAAADPDNLINRGRPIAWFNDPSDPASLQIAPGYAPDFDRMVEKWFMASAFYGGRVRRFRFLSVNARIQWLFMAAPRRTWIIPPQALTTELSSYGVRTIDVIHDDALCVPGYEFHYYEDSPEGSVLVSQIPAGFVGRPHPRDDSRCDASAWIESMPLIREFRRRVLERK